MHLRGEDRLGGASPGEEHPRQQPREREREDKLGFERKREKEREENLQKVQTLRIVHVSSWTLFWKKKSSDSYLDTLKSLDFYMRKEKSRLISGHFEKFGLISDKKKVRTHI